MGFVHDRQFVMAVGRRAPMTGDMLHDRQHAARHEPFRHRAREHSHLRRLAAVGAITDHIMRSDDRNVRDRARNRC